MADQPTFFRAVNVVSPEEIGDKLSEDSLEAYIRSYSEAVLAGWRDVAMSEILKLIFALREVCTYHRQVFIAGNGGSASLASHMATDLGNRILDGEFPRLRVISLCDNMARVSAAANDSGYENIFSRQMENLLVQDDLMIAISASGNSPNVINALSFARAKGAKTCGIVGFDGGAAKDIADIVIHFPTSRGAYGITEDLTSMLNHVVTNLL